MVSERRACNLPIHQLCGYSKLEKLPIELAEAKPVQNEVIGWIRVLLRSQIYQLRALILCNVEKNGFLMIYLGIDRFFFI